MPACRHVLHDPLRDAADLLTPAMDDASRRSIEDAIERSTGGYARVVVFGEAKRGKSSLVNALFGESLLPTGVLPLTSVATVVRAGPDRSARVRDLNGGWRSLASVAEAAELVTETGNPGNRLGLDVVELTVPGGVLPPGTEIVDTPGTGSVHALATDEARRSRQVLDVAVLVVSVDPPVSAAELDLLADVHVRATRGVVVVNKTDLVGPEQADQVLTFTRDVVRERVADLPVLAVSAIGEQAGVEPLTQWLAAQLDRHAAEDAVASTRRLLLRQAASQREEARTEQELLRRHGAETRSTVDELTAILRRGAEHRHAATDRVEGEARRLRRLLDEQHDAAVETERSAAVALLHSRDTELPGRDPDRWADEVRGEIAGLARGDAELWFGRCADELRDGLLRAADGALRGLGTELAEARARAAAMLGLDLDPVGGVEEPAPFATPRFVDTVTPGWEELVTASIGRRLPRALRRGRVRRRVATWAADSGARAFGQARAALQGELERCCARVVTAIGRQWDAQLAGLARGLDAAGDAGVRSADRDAHRVDELDHRLADLDRAVALLGPA